MKKYSEKKLREILSEDFSLTTLSVKGTKKKSNVVIGKDSDGKWRYFFAPKGRRFKECFPRS